MRLKLFTLSAIAALCTFSGCGTVNGNKADEQAKYIFFFIGDGMGQAQMAVTESYLAYKDGELGGIGRLSFTKFPYIGMASTYSANHSITCSSASGTALATGCKTNNGVLGKDANGEILKSYTYDLKEKGYQIGIMSNVPVNHATPASFYAHANSRGDYYEISLQIPESGFDFFAGDGFLDFNGKDNDKEDIDNIIESEGYTVSYGLSEYEAEKDADKIVLCQARNRKTASKDYFVEHTEDKDLTLAEMLDVAIDRFSANGKPFFIMAECGNIDWACHANRTMSVTEKVLELDDAVKEAYSFYLEHPDETLIIITADHETGGLTLTDQNGYDFDWKVLEESWIANDRQDVLSNDENAKLNNKANIGWASDNHSGIPVPVYAIGKGAERFGGCYDNTDIAKKIMLTE